MAKFNAKQKFLFPAEANFHLRPLEKYEILFSFLDTSRLKRLYPSTSRHPIPYEALLRALIYKGLKTLSYFSDLVRELRDNLSLASMLGFQPLRLLCIESFSALFQDTENSIFQEVSDPLASELIDLKEIKGTYLSFHSCGILAKVKEKNLKSLVKNRLDKTKRPNGYPECRLGIMVHFPKPFHKENELSPQQSYEV